MANNRERWLAVFGVLLVVLAVLLFSRYRQCATTADGATLIKVSNSQRIGELEVAVTHLTARLEAVEAERDLATTTLDACHQRTEDLRAVLEALIPIWPGRARLPMPNGPWSPWPTAGGNRDDFRYLPTKPGSSSVSSRR